MIDFAGQTVIVTGKAIVRTALDRLGRLDAVVSNAGIFHLSQPAFGAMKARGQGRFVFIASSAGLFGQPHSAHYAAAKAGTVGLANVIAIEGAPDVCTRLGITD